MRRTKVERWPRAFPAIPARHVLARRMDSNYLANLVARQVIDMSDELAYELVKNAYNLD